MQSHKNSLLIFSFLSVIVAGTLGYHFIEDWTLLDGFYMTMISITTVGFSEVHPLSTMGRLFTVGLILTGLGLALTVASHFTSLLIKGELQTLLGRRRMESAIKKMKNHYIIGGFGRTGHVIADQFQTKKIPFVIIDQNQETLMKSAEAGFPYIQGNASDAKVLKDAGIEKAKGFISVVSNDADNAFAIMTAKNLNPRLFIVSRAMDSESVPKLKMAGAHKVFNPYLLGGTRIAQSVFSPHAADFVELLEDVHTDAIEMADVSIAPGSQMDGQSLNSDKVRSNGLIVIGIRKPSGEFVFQPSGNTRIEAYDHLILIGHSKDVESFANWTGKVS